jgi:outer membrane protein TolC
VRAGCAAAEALGEQLAAAERSIANRRLLLDAVRERLRRGASTRIELGLVQISIARAEQERDDIAVRRGGVLREIAAAAALPSDAAFELDATKRPSVAAADEAPPPSLPKVREQALKQRPLLRADAARAENRDETVRAESSRAWPWFSFAAIPRYRLRGDASQFQSDISFAIDISLPIFEGNGGRIASAEAERRRQEGLHAANVAAVRRDVDVAGAEATRRKDMLDRYRATLEPLLHEHTATLQEALQARQLDVVTMLASEDLVSRVQRERAEAKLAYRNALLRLQRAAGGLAAGR